MDSDGAIVAAFITAVAGIFAAFIQRGRAQEECRHRAEAEQQRDEFEDQARGLTLPAKIPQGDKRNSVMLIGIGGSGKTSLIRQLFHDPQANPEEATEHYEIYSRMSRSGTVISPPENGGQAVHLFISDYKGQDLGSLVRAFIRQQKQSYSPMAYNYVTALILIVDLIAPPTHKGEIVPPREHPDPNRVAAQIDQWTDSALDAVFGMLTNTLKYVCLFINKIDLITSHTPKDRNRIRKMYAEVEARLAKRSTGATFEVFIGSATDGTQLPILEQRLLECSVPDAALFDGRE